MTWRPLAGRWGRATWIGIGVVAIAAMALVALVVYTASTSAPGRTSARRPSSSRAPSATTTTAPAAAQSGGTATTTASWTVYHGTPAGSGSATASVTLGTIRQAWTSPALDGQVYGEPLVDDDRVVVATENDTVYELDAANGSVVWSTHLATPVPSSQLPCGDITPVVGVTGTPVIDPTRDEVFVVADELVDGTPAHHLVGLDLSSGAVELDQVVDPPGADTAALLQRTGLALDEGNVVFGFGGNFGDCGDYHGWVESVPAAGGTVQRYELDSASGDRQGAIWMGGAAPEVDGSGDIWVAAGNGSVYTATASYDGSDSVIELSPSLTRLQYFAPSTWRTDNAEDHDLGSTAPALLSDGTVLQVGKAETGYLLSSSDLGGVGGQQATAHVCTGDADGGDAVSGTTVYVACKSGVAAVHTAASPPSLSVTWTASAATGPPIVAGGLVWSVSDGTLFGLAPSTGTTAVQVSLGSNANHFPTPSVGDGLLLATGGTMGDEVLAFAGSAPLPPGPSSPTSSTTSG